MADRLDIALRGHQEIIAALEAVKGSLTAPELRKVYMAAGRVIAARAKVLAPRARYSRNPGLLRRSIATFGSRTRSKERVAAITWVRVFNGTAAARHAHLVEFGSRGERTWGGRVMRFRNSQTGEWIAARRVRPMPASHFFQRAVEETGPRALETAARETEVIIQNRWTAARGVFA